MGVKAFGFKKQNSTETSMCAMGEGGFMDTVKCCGNHGQKVLLAALVGLGDSQALFHLSLFSSFLSVHIFP